MKLSLDHARFDRDVRKLAKLTGKSLAQILDEQGRLFVRDCVRATPPFTPGKNWTEPLGAQRSVGVNATEGQVRSAFQDINELDVYRNHVSGKKGATGRSLRSLIQRGRFSQAKELLRKIGVRIGDLQRAAMPTDHQKLRDKRGRVRSTKGRKVMVVLASSIPRLVRQKVANVGLAKSGWVKAATALKLALPNWIKKHSSPGIFIRSGTPDKPAITVGNGVPWIQGTGQELGIMQWAYKNRLRNLPKQVEQTLRAQLKKARAI